MPTDHRLPSQRSRKLKALLAGGMVLGVGAAVTLAAWTDYEWVSNDFVAGAFNLEGSTDGVTFTDHAVEGDAAELPFSIEAAGNLTPGDAVAAPFLLRLDESTTGYTASVELASAAAEGANAANLSYGIVQVADASACTVDATGEAVVPAGTPLGTDVDGELFRLESGDGEAGAPVALCFQLTAGPDLLEGEAASATWQFAATSID